MTGEDLRAGIDAADAYEALLVPALIGRFAAPTADAARLAAGNRVLDVGCGTGVLAREAAVRCGPRGAVTGLDPGAGMLAVAARQAPALEWRRGTAEALPFADGAFDAVLSQFALMFFAERGRALSEMLRVLRPGGRLAVTVWAGLEQQPAYAAEVELLERVAGSAAADCLRAPFVLGDRRGLEALFAGAGAAAVEVETVERRAAFPDVRTMVEADLRGWLPALGVELAEDVIERTLHEAEAALRPFVVPSGRVEFEARAHVVAARPSADAGG